MQGQFDQVIYSSMKRIVLPNIENSVINYSPLMLFQNLKTFVHLQNTN